MVAPAQHNRAPEPALHASRLARNGGGEPLVRASLDIDRELHGIFKAGALAPLDRLQLFNQLFAERHSVFSVGNLINAIYLLDRHCAGLDLSCHESCPRQSVLGAELHRRWQPDTGAPLLVTSLHPGAVSHLWGLSAANRSADEMRWFAGLATGVIPKLPRSEHLDLLNEMAVGCSRDWSPVRRFFGLSAAHLQGQAAAIEPNEMVRITAAYARYGYFAHGLIESLLHHAKHRLIEFSPTELVGFTANLADLNIPQRDFFKLLASEAETFMEDYSSEQLASLMCSFAKVNCFPEQFNRLAMSRIPSDAGNISAAALVKLLWAHTVFERPQAIEFAWTELENRDPREFSNADLRRLMHCCIACDRVMPEHLSADLHRRNDPRAPISMSSFESEVLKSLLVLRRLAAARGIALFFAREALYVDFLVDFLVEAKGRTIALECDGAAYHRAGRTNGGERVGRDVVKDRVFANLDLELRRLSPEQWNKVALDRRAEFLAELLFGWDLAQDPVRRPSPLPKSSAPPGGLAA